MKPTYGVPAILSAILPGLGQLIKGQLVKAVIIWIASGLVGFFLWWTFIVPFLLWAWNVYDAYNDPA
jgi:TM2 domain-containing membrane protein YozV